MAKKTKGETQSEASEKPQNGGAQPERSAAPPAISIRSGDAYLAVWVSGNRLRVSVSRRVESGYERYGPWVIPIDYLIYKVLETKEGREVIKKAAEFVEALSEE